MMEMFNFPDELLEDPNSESGMETEPGDNIGAELDKLTLEDQKAEKTNSYDDVMGIIERLVISDEFGVKQSDLLKKYYRDIEKNEVEFFEEYSHQMTTFFEEQIKTLVIPSFNLHKFIEELKTKTDFLEGEIYEMLLGLRDIEKFKELVEDYASMMDGKADLILSGMTVRPIHIDPEDSDAGEEMGKE